MGLAHLVIDLDELGRRRRYADATLGNNGPNSENGGGDPNAGNGGGLFGGAFGQWRAQQGAANAEAQNQQAAAGGVSPVTTRYGATGAQINDPGVDPNAYQYGGAPGGAAAFNQQLGQQRSTQMGTQGAQIDQSQVGQTLGGLSSFYQGQMNGTGPSLAAAQMQQATDQNIAAQQAAANSARGSLAGVSAQMGAAQNAATAEQNAANQSMQGRIAEEYNAAQGMQGVAGTQAGLATSQAQLQEQQQLENARLGLGYSGLQNQVNTEQMGAQEQQQAQMSGNYLAASGMGMNQSQFNSQQNANLAMGGLGLGVGLLGALADADFEEPSAIGRKGGAGYADGDMRAPAHLTLREEPTVDGSPFMLIADQNTHQLRKIATQPLSPAEQRQAMAPHGAGPIFAQGAGRAHTTMHDMSLADMAGAGIGDAGSMGIAGMPGPYGADAGGGLAGSMVGGVPTGGAADALTGHAGDLGEAAGKKTANHAGIKQALLGAQQGLASMVHPMAVQPYTPMMPSAYEAHITPYADLDLDDDERGLARIYTDATLGPRGRI